MRRRSGFTITELLVSMALIVFIMSILAGAFDAGIGAFRRVKAIGDMNERLRTATTTLRRLLSADHFDGKRRLSDPNFWQNGPPTEGFFRIYQGSGTYVPPPLNGVYAGIYEGVDADGYPSFRSTDHALHFAVKLRGNGRGDFFRASVPGNGQPCGPSPRLSLPNPDSRYQDSVNTYCSPWAEVAVFMVPSGDTAKDPNNPGGLELPLSTLYLRQRVAIWDNNLLSQSPPSSSAYSPINYYTDVSCYPDPSNNSNLYVNGPMDLTMPARRLGTTGSIPGLFTSPTPNGNFYPRLADEPGGIQSGNDVLLTDVLSFDARVLLPSGSDFVDLFNTGGSVNNTSFNGANGPRVFDTWSSMADANYDYSTWNQPTIPGSSPAAPNPAAIPMYPLQILAIQINIRVWDAKTQQARQSSIVQEL